MKESLMDILCCPMCKSDLELQVLKRDKDEIISGKLRCTKCDNVYPIEDGIPNMLPPERK